MSICVIYGHSLRTNASPSSSCNFVSPILRPIKAPLCARLTELPCLGHTVVLCAGSVPPSHRQVKHHRRPAGGPRIYWMAHTKLTKRHHWPSFCGMLAWRLGFVLEVGILDMRRSLTIGIIKHHENNSTKIIENFSAVLSHLATPKSSVADGRFRWTGPLESLLTFKCSRVHSS